MSRYIDEDRLYINIEEKYKVAQGDARKAYNDVLDTICEIPTADVQEVRHGHWVREVTEIEDTYYFKAFCSVCNRRAVVKYKFCPHCGAKMDEEEQE